MLRFFAQMLYLNNYKTKVTFLLLGCLINSLAINNYTKQIIEADYATHENILCQT